MNFPLFHLSIEDAMAQDASREPDNEYIRISQRLLQTLDGHNTGARADVAAILGVDDLKIGRES